MISIQYVMTESMQWGVINYYKSIDLRRRAHDGCQIRIMWLAGESCGE